MLDNLECFNVEAKSVRPVWLTFAIPSDAVAGDYKSTLKLYAGGSKVEDFEITLNVVDQVLPEPSSGSIILTCGNIRRPWQGCITWKCGAMPILRK
jgi:hypothetical protein